jgi:hypothetical protein
MSEKTDPGEANQVFPINLSVHPFRRLRVGPAANNQQIDEAFDLARQEKLASVEELINARESIVDLSRRLPHELSYPIDSSSADVDAIYAVLSNDMSLRELLSFAERLPPLSRANYLAHLATTRSTDDNMLCALLRAHACIEPMEVYETIRELRRTGARPAPSLASVKQGLQHLLASHDQAAINGLKRGEGWFVPVLTCTQQTLSRNDRHQIEALGNLLAAYRQSIHQQQADKIQEIKTASHAIGLRPTDISTHEAFAQALTGWELLLRPAAAFNVHQGIFDPEFQTPLDLVRSLTSDLVGRDHIEVALEVTHLARNVLGSMPKAIESLDEDTHLIEGQFVDLETKPLEDFVDRFESDFNSLIPALKASGFGQNSKGPAKELWNIFVQVVEATKRVESAEPWLFIRDLALHLHHNVEDRAAGSALVSGLLQHGQSVSAAPSLLSRLREDLRVIQPEHCAETSRPPKSVRNGKLWWAGFALAAIGAVALYVAREGTDRLWSKSLTRTANGSKDINLEVEPSVGAGQHFSLGNLRYCQFQEERLRVMKANVHGADDTRAFNLLAVDYNSRCSDYLYQDSDVAIVSAEVIANRQRLADEAARIMLTWPGHAKGSAASAE